MKNKIFVFLLLFTIKLSFAQSPSSYCANMGDNRLNSWIGAVSSTQTAIPIEKGYFKFQNSQNGRVTFTFGNIRIDLPPNGLSMPIKGEPPTSLPTCDVKIDNIPLSEYYKVVDFEITYQKAHEDIGKIHWNRYEASESDLRSAIASCDQLLKTIGSHKSKMPSWFMRIYTQDMLMDQTQSIRKNLEDALTNKQNSPSSTSGNPSGQAGNSISTSQSNSNEHLQEGKTSSSANSPADDFWNDDNPSQKSSDNVVPHQPMHDDLPDLIQTTGGGYYQRGSDGEFREIDQDEYYLAKKRTINTEQGEKRLPTQQEIDYEVSKIMSTARAEQDAQQAIMDGITRESNRLGELWQQNFYTAEAVRNGKASLEELSSLGGNYHSVQDIENEFNRKYNAIKSEVNRIQHARDAHVANVVAYQNQTQGRTASEQAVATGIGLIANVINSGTAAKEERQAKEALQQERDRQIAAFEAAKLQALINVRSNLVATFPNGGSPISSHKITQPEVYMFSYIVDEASFPDENASIEVSNVFTLYKYDDGTYPYSTTVSSNLKSFGKGKVVLVGYYLKKEEAAKMRTSFINLSIQSGLAVNQFEFGTKAPSSSGTKTSVDFWETGKTETTTNKTTEKSSSFWDD